MRALNARDQVEDVFRGVKPIPTVDELVRYMLEGGYGDDFEGSTAREIAESVYETLFEEQFDDKDYDDDD